MKSKQTSLAELSSELGINKSKLAYYFSLGLIKPITTIGKMNIFDREITLKIIKNIGKLQKEGKDLKEIHSKLKVKK